MNALLSTAYWPNLHYFFYVLNSDAVTVEQFENYQKQSYRNRTRILTANGPLDLCIPVKKKYLKELSKEIEISYSENWQINHRRAIESAYKNSPYFDFFEDEIAHFYAHRFQNLFDYNKQQLNVLLRLLRQKKEIYTTTEFKKNAGENVVDLRNVIHPKINFKEDKRIKNIIEKPYYQTFENKFNFNPNLSTLDLLFNKGLETADYLVP